MGAVHLPQNPLETKWSLRKMGVIHHLQNPLETKWSFFITIWKQSGVTLKMEVIGFTEM
jgi:hypothetical protein